MAPAVQVNAHILCRRLLFVLRGFGQRAALSGLLVGLCTLEGSNAEVSVDSLHGVVAMELFVLVYWRLVQN